MNKNTDTIKIDGEEFRKQGTTNPNQKINPKNFNLNNNGIRWGIAGGVGMALFLVAAQLMTIGDSMVLKFFKYIVLFGILLYGLTTQRSFLQQNYKFRNGIQLGAIVTAISAITLALMNVLIFAFSENLAFGKFSLEADSVGNVAVLSGVLLFEVLVFGMILTFIILQAIKPKRQGAKKPS